MRPTFTPELLLTPIELITTEAVSFMAAAVELLYREKRCLSLETSLPTALHDSTQHNICRLTEKKVLEPECSGLNEEAIKYGSLVFNNSVSAVF